MKTPFTIKQFFEVFEKYNSAVFPMQIVLYVAAIVAIYLAIRPANITNKYISGFLSFLWLWMGVVYQLIFFTSINKAAYVFGVVFILQGILFLFFGVFKDEISFCIHRDKYGVTGFLLILFALLIYPLIGLLSGRDYVSLPTFGLPCPTTIFTFGLLFFCDRRCPYILLIIPFLWSIIGFAAALQFIVLEDAGLLVAGLIGSSMLVTRNRKYRPGNIERKQNYQLI